MREDSARSHSQAPSSHSHTPLGLGGTGFGAGLRVRFGAGFDEVDRFVVVAVLRVPERVLDESLRLAEEDFRAGLFFSGGRVAGSAVRGVCVVAGFGAVDAGVAVGEAVEGEGVVGEGVVLGADGVAVDGCGALGDSVTMTPLRVPSISDGMPDTAKCNAASGERAEEQRRY